MAFWNKKVKDSSEGLEVAEDGTTTTTYDEARLAKRQRRRELRSRFKLDTHHTIERFGVMVSVLGVSLVMILSSSFYYAHQADNAVAASKALYNTSFKTSKSGVSGTVEGIYSDKNRTRAMILMQFENPAQMSAIAKNYQSFLAGTNNKLEHEPIKGSPKGSIYVFGSTGYMAVYLVNPNSFESQILSLTMRANQQLVDPGADGAQEPVSAANLGESFSKHDQWRVFFNPGATGVKHLKALDAKNPTVHDIYAETVIVPQEKTIRETLNSDLSTMKSDISAIGDYTARLTMTSVNGLHVKTPAVPAIIAGDKVVGQDAYGKTGSTLKLQAKQVFKDGFDFDWRSGSVQKGYLDKVIPKGQNYLTWLTKKSQQTPQDLNVSGMKWTMTDGSDLSDQASSDLQPIQQINSNISLLTQSYQNYYNNKHKYQVTDLGDLLNLEISLKDVVDNNTVNDTAKAVKLY